jgi:predicted CXXCH cytochrome family protein
LIANAQRPICFNCHKAQAGLDPEQLLHGPAALGECFECHVSHRDAAKAGSPLRKPVPSLCWECHDASLMAGKVKHAPAEAGECVQCHSPHGTKNAKFLVEVVPDLCATCHQGIEHVDDMLKERQVCTECHSPHSSPNEHLLKE